MNVATPNIPTPWASSWTYTKTGARKYHFSLQVKCQAKGSRGQLAQSGQFT
jgi:hypothetical protein